MVAHFRPDIVSGAELAIADMVDKRSAGIDYVMLAPGEGRLAEHCRTRGFPVWSQRVETRRRLYPGLHTVQSFFFARKLRKAGIDVVLSNTFPAAGRVGTACRIARVPHCVYVREYIRGTPLRRRQLREANRVLAVSKDVANYLREIEPSARLAVAYDYLNTQTIEARARAHAVSATRLTPFGVEHPVIGIVGRITTYKQPHLFLQAAPAVLEKVPLARFAVVGSAVDRERPYEESLRRLADELGIGHQVAFMGHRTDAVEIMSELAVCCLTSDREPFPRSILEAQSVGCPTIASNTGGCPEMVENGVNGALFPVSAPDAHLRLASEIVQMLQNPVRTRLLATRAKERLGHTFGSMQPVRQFEDHLHALMQDQTNIPRDA